MWILILVLNVGYGDTSQQITMNNEKACLAAKAEWMIKANVRDTWPQSYCINNTTDEIE